MTAPADQPPPPITDTKVASVTVTPTGVSGNIGETGQFTATARNAAGLILSDQVVTWSVTDPTIVTVNSSGLVSAVGVGAVTVVAAAGDISGQAQVTVTGESIAAIMISPDETVAAVGDVGQFHATLMGDAGNVLTGRPVIWTTDDASIATVDSIGRTTHVGPGIATITAASAGRRGRGRVRVGGATQGPPGAVSDLAVLATTDTSATLTFTQVNDGTGHPANYIVRYAVAPMVWESSTAVARGTCTSPVAGSVINSVRTCTVLGLSPSATYDFGVLAYRGTPGVSAVYGGPSNVASGSTSATPPVPVASVTVSPGAPTLVAGQVVQFTAQVKDAGGNVLAGRSITWASSNSSVVTVNTGGLATAVGAGSAVVTATEASVSGAGSPTVAGADSAVITGSGGQKSGHSDVTVTAAPPRPPSVTVASVMVSPTAASLLVGARDTLTATVLDANAIVLTGQTVTWSTSNAAIARVNSSGVVTGVAVGSVTISATSSGKTGSSSVTVTTPPPPPPTVASVTVSPATASVMVGATQTLTATVRDAQGNVLSGQTVVWTTGNGSAASVNSSGVVSALAAGSATISATCAGKTGSASVTVTALPPTVASVTVAPSTVTLAVGATQQLTATVRDGQGNVLSGQTVSWSTANGAKATVNANGVVLAVAAGSTTITATSSGKSGSASVTVTPPPPGTVSDLAVLATTDTSATLTFTQVNDGTGHSAKYDIRYALTPIASGWGSATSVSRGSCTSPLSGNGISGTRTCTVFGLNASTGYDFQMVAYRVTLGVTYFGGLSNVAGGTTAAPSGPPPPGPPASVTVSPATASIGVGASQPLVATVLDAAGNVLTGLTITWLSNHTSIASVDANGVVTGVAAGSASITATTSGKSGSASVTVTSAPPPPPPGGWPNEPAGFTVFSDQKWDAMNGWVGENGTAFTSTTDPRLTTLADAPFPEKTVLQYLEPTGMLGGGGGGTPGPASANFFLPRPNLPTELFVGAWVKIGSPYQPPPSLGQKIWYIQDNDQVTGNAGFMWLEFYGDVGNNYVALVNQMTANTALYLPNVTRTPLHVGQWHQYEMYFKQPTSLTANDGVIKVWIDGTLNISLSNVPGLFYGARGFDSVHQDMQWGGGGVMPQDQYIWATHNRVSGR